MDEFIEKLRDVANRVSEDDAKIINQAAAHLTIAFSPAPTPDYQSVNKIPIGDGRELIHYFQAWR